MWSAQAVPTITSPSRTGPSAQDGVGIAAASSAAVGAAAAAGVGSGAAVSAAPVEGPSAQSPTSASASVTATVPRNRPIHTTYPAQGRTTRPGPWRSLLGFRRGLALPVVDLGVEVEEGVEAAALGEALGGAELVRVGIDDDVRCAVGRDGEEADLLVGRVQQLVGADLAERKVDRLARLELTRALRRAQRRPPREHEDELLVGVVEVVRVGGLAGRQLPDAGAEPLAAKLVADPGAEGAEAGRRPGALLEVRLLDVGHGAQLKAPHRG